MTHYRSRKDKHQQPTGDDFNTTRGKRHKERIFARSLGMTRKAFLKKRKRLKVAAMRQQRIIQQNENRVGD